MDIILGILIIIVLLALPVWLTASNIIAFSGNLKKLTAKGQWLTMILGPVFTFLLFGFFQNYVEWYEPIYFNSGDLMHAPVAGEHIVTFAVIAIAAGIGWAVLRRWHAVLPPLAAVVCMAAMYAGCALSVVWMIQVVPTIATGGWFDIIGWYMVLFPINFIMLSVLMTRDVMLAVAASDEYRASKFAGWLTRGIGIGVKLPLVAFFAIFPVIGVIICLLLLFGQAPDAVIKAFTETADWTLSTKIPPPPIEYHGHYLCTAAEKGHHRIVKPTRLGIRHGAKIMVNRQLCVANAFEQLISERAPRIHRVIRHFYDTYGYPVSKLIRSPFAADVTYVVMKPAEWLFVAVLYFCDRHPESRICRQYLPCDKIKRWS